VLVWHATGRGELARPLVACIQVPADRAALAEGLIPML
jgi:hypothetical protein